MHLACRYGYENIVRCLIGHGADINGLDQPLLLTPLQMAVIDGHENIVRCLVEHGADVNKANCKKWTPLESAVRNKYKNITTYLIEHSANIDKLNMIDIIRILSLIKSKNKYIVIVSFIVLFISLCLYSNNTLTFFIIL